MSLRERFKNVFFAKTPDEIRAEERLSTAAGREDLLIDSVSYLIKEQRKAKRSKWLMRTFWVLTIFGPLVFIWMPDTSGYLSAGKEKVAIININGVIGEKTASSDQIAMSLVKAFENKTVKAIVISVDSPGGHPQDAERIYNVIEKQKVKNPKPITTVINRMGASAAYMIAIHTDEIVAGRYSLVGSIGAILSGWDAHKVLENFGIEYRTYASGKYKSILNPFLPMTEDASEKAQHLVNKMAKSFENDVLDRRGAKLKGDVDYFTGEVWQGSDALEIGLVDQIGTLEEHVRTKYGDDIHVVTYTGAKYTGVNMSSFFDSLSSSFIEKFVEFAGIQTR